LPIGFRDEPTLLAFALVKSAKDAGIGNRSAIHALHLALDGGEGETAPKHGHDEDAPLSAHHLPSLLASVTTVDTMAWQQNAK
jgi:hypothetical protein